MQRILILLIAPLFTSWAQAIPLQLDKAAFTTATAGLETLVEDFESTSTGNKPNPFQFANGSFSSAFRNPYVWLSATACGDAADRCLSSSSITTVAQVFSSLPLYTQYFGTSFHSVNGTDLFDISVIGGSGILNLSAVPAINFYGFHDPLGLSSISFRNRGTDYGSARGWSYFTFDDVTTAVPAPGTSLLLIGALATLLRVRRRV